MQDDLILDGTKIQYYQDRVEAWERGERISPITIDMALLPRPKCNFNCVYCYADLQEQDGWDKRVIDERIITDFLDDAAEIGVKGISLVSDGESSHSPVFVHTIQYGASLGLDMAVGSNALVVGPKIAEQILPHLTYFRVNISAGEPGRYGEIMGVKPHFFERVCENIAHMVRIKQERNLPVTIGLQMVVQPSFEDQILPLARLGKELRPDYLVLKHCSDDEFGTLGVDYAGYEGIYDTLKEAEALSDDTYKVVVKWSKIKANGKRSYQRCYGPPFIIQLSGTGLVAPCGMCFNDRYKDKFHIGNICTTRFKQIWESDRYWETMKLLASPKFNAQTMCGSLCLQHCTNVALDEHVKGIKRIVKPEGSLPAHGAFI